MLSFKTKAQIAFVTGLILLWDVSTYVAQSIESDRCAYEEEIARLTEQRDEAVRIREEDAELYSESLMEIATTLYERESYSMGGFETDEGADVTALYQAVMNYSNDYRDLLSVTENYFDERDEFLAEVPSIWPVEYNELTRITSGFGWRLSPVFDEITYHTGVDIAGTWNAKVIAPADGVVVEHWIPPDGRWRGHDTYGGMVKIRHAGGFETVYAHLKWTDLANIHEGNEIRQGDRIGIMGDTGVSRGDHLHYEVWLNGVPVNPLDYLRF